MLRGFTSSIVRNLATVAEDLRNAGKKKLGDLGVKKLMFEEKWPFI